MRQRGWTDHQLIEAVRSSTSEREALGKPGLVTAGGNYKELRKHATRPGLDLSRFRGQGHGKGRGSRRSLAEILVRNSTYTNSNGHRLRLIREGVPEARCAERGLTNWRGQPIPLHLEHANGLENDPRLENLRAALPQLPLADEDVLRKEPEAEVVPGAGLEPARLAPGHFKCPVSTDSTTQAGRIVAGRTIHESKR